MTNKVAKKVAICSAIALSDFLWPTQFHDSCEFRTLSVGQPVPLSAKVAAAFPAIFSHTQSEKEGPPKFFKRLPQLKVVPIRLDSKV